MSYLIVFRSLPDVDHMAPLAWQLLEDGEEVHAVISPGLAVDGDHRFALLGGYPAFNLHELLAHRGGRVGKAIAGARCTVPYAVWLLRRNGVRALAVEWGAGLAAGYERPRSPAGWIAVIRSTVGSLRRAGRDVQQPRASFMVAARMLGIATVCLPHGVNVKLDIADSDQFAERLAAGKIDWRDRNRVAAYVLETEHHRRQHIEHFGGDPAIMQAWGSLRWSPQWFALNRRLAAPLDWPEDAAGRVRVLFMTPRWANRVDADGAIELLGRLQDLDAISLAIMGHPRPLVAGSERFRDDERVDWRRLQDLSGHSSVSAIEAADVVIDLGSSIGLEVVMQDKVLVNPGYLHDLTTLFDTVSGCCVRAGSAGEVIDYLRAHAAGSAHRVSGAARRELLRHAVFASRPEPYDVPAHYARRIRELADAAGSPRAPG